MVQAEGRRWPQTDKVWRQFGQMDRVMRRLEIDQTIAARKDGGLALAQARDICRSCILDRRCQAWLDSNGNRNMLASFCPNAGFFEECR